RRGPKKAICAVAASILTAAYHMLKDGTFYEDLGAVHFDRRRPETQARRLVKRLAELGFSVELKPAAAVSCRMHDGIQCQRFSRNRGPSSGACSETECHVPIGDWTWFLRLFLAA